MTFETGQTILRRDVHRDGRIAWVQTARVVSDDDRGVLTWTAAGSETMVRTTLGGGLIRRMTLAERSAVPTMLSPRPWRDTGVLILTPPGVAHSIWWFFDLAGTFTGWYVNLEAPSVRRSGGLDSTDFALDICVEPDRSWAWKDEDEFAERTGHRAYWTAAEAPGIRAEGERLVALVEAGGYPFDGSLVDFRPDPSWKPSVLPPDWDVTA
ncbi:DUF402 domain-containing protein [Longispora urticae]